MEIKSVSIGDELFPKRLENIKGAPKTLWYVGDISILNNHNVLAVIGTREPSAYGAMCAYRIGELCAENDVINLSGLAYGCDIEGHRGTISKNGLCCAVLANGFGSGLLYPRQHIKDAVKIVNNGGVLVSAYAPGERCNRSRFVERDHLQSMLSDSVFVIETATRGGTLHCTFDAINADKTVYTLHHPARFQCEKSTGNEMLVENYGAIPVANKHDIEDMFFKIKNPVSRWNYVFNSIE